MIKEKIYILNECYVLGVPSHNHYTRCVYKADVPYSIYDEESIYSDDLIDIGEIKIVDFRNFENTIKDLSINNPIILF